MNEIIKLTNNDIFIQRNIMYYLGMYWSKNLKKYVKYKNKKPLINKKGAIWCINFLNSYNQNNEKITYFKKDDYKSIMKDVIKIAHYVPAVRSEDFGLKTNKNIMEISNLLITLITLKIKIK